MMAPWSRAISAMASRSPHWPFRCTLNTASARRRARQRFFQVFGPHQSGFGIDIGEHDLRAVQVRRAGRGQEGDGGHDDVAAGPEIERARGHVQRRGAVGADHRVFGADGLGERGLEAGDGGPGGQKVAAQRLGDGGDVFLVDDLAAIGKEGSARRRFGSRERRSARRSLKGLRKQHLQAARVHCSGLGSLE